MNLWLRVAHQVILSSILVAWLIRLIGQRKVWPLTGLELPLVLFLAVRFASSLTAIDPRMSLELFWRPFTHLLLFYWLVWLLRGNEKRMVLRSYFLVMGVVCVVGMTEFVGWYLGLPILPVFQEGWLQIGGLCDPIPPSSWRLNFTLSSATSLSTYLSLLILPAVLMASRAKRRDIRVGWILLISAAVVVQILTRSRGGLLGLGVSIAAAIVAYGAVLGRHRIHALWQRMIRSKLFWTAVVLSAVIVLAFVLVLLPDYVRRRTTLDIRIQMWKCAVETVIQHPFLGVGPGGYGRALRSCVAPGTDTYERFTTAHNLYLNIAAESGIVGIAAFAILLVGLVLRIRDRWARAAYELDHTEVILIAATLVGYAVNCLFDTLTPTPLVLPVLFLVAWLVAPLSKWASPGRWTHWVRTATLGAVIVYLGSLLWLDYGQLRFEQGIAAARNGDYRSAAESVRLAGRLDRSLGLYRFQEAFYLGNLAHDDPEGFLEPAIAAQESAIQLDDSYSVHLANLAALYWQNGESESAMVAMERALEKNPPDSALWLNHGLFAEQLGYHEQALDSYARVLAKEPQWASSGFWLESSFRRQSFDEILHRAAEATPDSFNLWFSAGDLDQAAASVLLPRTGTEFGNRGRLLFEIGALEEARADLSRAIELCPRCTAPYIDRSLIYWQSGLIQDAERDAKTALFISPGAAARAHATLAKIAKGAGDLDATIDHLWRAVAPQVDEYNWEAVLYNRRGDFGLLPQLLQIEGGADAFDPWLELAQLYISQNRSDQAAGVYRLILARDPFVPGVRGQLAALGEN
jgi:tetratricopeptide (TPR) repeat protein/O-antigen ligase